MALGATFWGNLGLAALWHDITTLLDNGLTTTGGTVEDMWFAPMKMYQEPMSIGLAAKKQHDNPGFDSGFFYTKETTTGEILWCDGVFMPGSELLSGSAINASFVLLVPNCKKRDLIPESITTPGIAYYEKSPFYKTGFIHEADATYPPLQTGGHDTAMKFFYMTDVGTWRLHHYSPYAWAGTPPEVTASAAMHAGVPADYIDQGAFDDAHDAYDLSTGDSPWSDLDTKWTIYANRLVGQKVSDFLINCMNHGRDLLFVNEAGKLSTSSWTRPTHTTYGIDATDDQMISVISHTMAIRHLFNKVRASWGQAANQSWDDDAGSSSTPQYEEIYTTYEPTLQSKPNDKWVHDAEDTDSIARYGEIALKGRKAILDTRGQPQEVETSHYPFLLGPHVTTTSTYVWDESTDGGGMIHVTNWLASDAKPRAEIEIRQGPMGFDLSIGDQITNLEITGDGRTIAEARIIERTYNFDTLTIDSLIMEVPDNT